MVTIALSAMDNTIVATALPQVVGDLGGFTLFSWVFSAYLLTQTVSIPIYGKLADQCGRKPILISGTIVSAVVTIVAVLAIIPRRVAPAASADQPPPNPSRKRAHSGLLTHSVRACWHATDLTQMDKWGDRAATAAPVEDVFSA